MRTHLLSVVGLLVVGACAHTETYPTGPSAKLPPHDSTGIAQITFGTPIDTGFQWTPDGSGILYHYADGTLVNGLQCFGIVPRLGGSRSWSYCDTRGSNADSIVHYSAASMSAGGQLLFMEAVYAIPPFDGPLAAPISTSIWLTDTANPAGHRRIVAKLPMLMGDSVISWISQPGWIDEQHFVFAGERYIHVTTVGEFPEPRILIMGTVTSSGATLQQIDGTQRALHWTRAPDGSLLFLRGQWWNYEPPPPGRPFRALMMDSVIVNVPLAGGIPVIVATTPRRLVSLQCSVGTCLATDLDDNCTVTSCSRPDAFTIHCLTSCGVQAPKFFYAVDPVTFMFTQVPTNGQPYLLPTSPMLSPDGSEFAYMRGKLFRAPWSKP